MGMSLNSALQIAASGVNAYQAAISVTSENISNINTPGYTTQTAVLETAAQPASSGSLSVGSGVTVTSIQRSYDAYLQTQIDNSQTTQGYDTANSTMLQEIQPSFNEVNSDGIGTAISTFFNAWQNVADDPTSTANRQSVVTAAQTLADNFNSVSNTLSSDITSLNTSLGTTTSSINQSLASIAQLNSQIKVITESGGNANVLEDQQDEAVQNLAKQIGITGTQNSDGTMDIKFTDTGDALVSGSQAGSFSLTTDAVTGLNDVNLTPAGSAASSAVSPVSGQLGATMVLMNTTIPGYQNQLNSLASTIATAVNTQQGAGYDLNGNSGAALFTSSTSAPISAATISLNPAITTSQIAAASASNSGDGNSALTMANLANDTTQMGGQTFSGYYNSLVSKVGQDVQTSKNAVTQGAAYSNQLSTLQQSNSGVSLNQELINLTTYQQSYGASAKVIVAVNNMMNDLLAMIAAA
ncbi:MAG: flagellar hook-associated protein FlgK [Oryzomonas sp.]|uniref:flagellar hook-associated protein FlgK n=1 Tax=Oryzomonas sp. TaxID=2855186 RepID=UPI002845A2CC|nr:flagellar hook-associated protein FlgK [Oryzomonas sp.]MDR3579101.1 flagellar hook-associated protein FlgK [Oryzomonas sp.]